MQLLIRKRNLAGCLSSFCHDRLSGRESSLRRIPLFLRCSKHFDKAANIQCEGRCHLSEKQTLRVSVDFKAFYVKIYPNNLLLNQRVNLVGLIKGGNCQPFNFAPHGYE